MIESITATIEWRHIPGYEGRYMISNFGEVMCLPRFQKNQLTGSDSFFPSRIMRPRKNKYGYMQIVLTGKKEHGESKTWCVHRLMGKTFLGAEDGDGMQINHKDGDKTNNRLDNLELITPSENSLHAFDIGLRPRKLDEEQIAQIIHRRLDGVPRREVAIQFGVHPSTVDNYMKDYKKGKIEWLEI